MSVFKLIDPDYNFWEMYPEFKKVEEFKFIQKEFKSKSSDVMWMLVASFDTDSKFFNLPLETRTEVLSKDYLKDKDFYRLNEKKLQPTVDMIIQLVDTPARRHRRQITDTLDSRTKFLKTAQYDLDNYDKLDKMIIGTTKIFESLKIVDKQLNEEKGTGATKGGHELSFIDSDD